MAAGPLTLTLLLAVTAGCGPEVERPPATADPEAGETTLGESIVAELNAARRRAGEETLEVDPALSKIAGDQAEAVAATGGTASSSGHITNTTRELYRAGYAAHRWTEGSLIAASDADVPGQWRSASPGWWREAETGDFEDVGVGVARYRGRPVVTLVLALPTRTWEWRQAAALADLGDVREQALAAVNELRREHDRRPVRSESRLDDAAQSHAEDMLRRAYYDHESPDGDGVRARVRAAGYGRAHGMSENIAKGFFTPEEVVQRWANSPGHRRNILDRGAAEMGFGVAYGENDNGFEVLWVQMFAER